MCCIRADPAFAAQNVGRPVAWLAALAAALCTACTTVRITEGSGAVRVERHFGLVHIELAPSGEALLAEVSSLGYQAGPMGTSMGFAHTSLAALPKACRLVVWLEHPAQIDALRKQLADSDGLCIANSITHITPTKEATP